MQPVSINFLALLTCGVINMVLGYAWFGPLFGKEWIKLIGMSDKKMEEAKAKGMGKLYAIAFIGALVMAFVLAHAVNYAGAKSISEGMMVGFWNWLGFIAVTQLGGWLWEGKPFKFFTISAGYYLITLMIMGAILAVWV